MNILELQDLIQKKSGISVNQSMLANAFGVTRQTISNRIKNDSEITVSEFLKAEKYFDVNLFNNNPNNNAVEVEFYPDAFASCGNGTLTLSDAKESIMFDKQLFDCCSPHKKYSIIYAKGDSMAPTINDKDKLLVEEWENKQISDNKIYVFCYKTEVFVKRLSKNLDEIIIKSDNPDYNTRVIKGENINDIRIIGEIVGIARCL